MGDQFFPPRAISCVLGAIQAYSVSSCHSRAQSQPLLIDMCQQNWILEGSSPAENGRVDRDPPHVPVQSEVLLQP